LFPRSCPSRAHRGWVDVIMVFLPPLRSSLHRDRAETWREPVLLLAIGVLVGTLVMILYLPVFHMAGAARSAAIRSPSSSVPL
jgi:hypothetical protein